MTVRFEEDNGAGHGLPLCASETTKFSLSANSDLRSQNDPFHICDHTLKLKKSDTMTRGENNRIDDTDLRNMEGVCRVSDTSTLNTIMTDGDTFNTSDWVFQVTATNGAGTVVCTIFVTKKFL